ncbi:MAG: GAF domain-containing protein [Planctomycetota bacterium]|nr:MAG: GAF domain-containing protein [Planctomycetota bacterium]
MAASLKRCLPAANSRPRDNVTSALPGRRFVPKATLLVVQGADQGLRFELDGGAVTLGRGALNPICLRDDEVSRTHAQIRFDESAGGFVIGDRQSSNGTFVNGEAIQTRKLSNGDQIAVGTTAFLFQEAAVARPIRAADQLEVFVGDDVRERSSIISELSQEVGQQLLRDATSIIKASSTTQTLANLQVLYRITEAAVTPTLSLDQLLHRILELTIEVVGADRGCVLVNDPRTSQLTPQAFSHRRGFSPGSPMPVSRSIVDYVRKKGQGVRTSDAPHDQRFSQQSIMQAGIREAMCVPMQGRYELMGVLYLDITTPSDQVPRLGPEGHRFTEETLHLLAAIGRQTALAVENHRFQDAFLKAERLAAVGQTIAILSHHIKNILQGVRGGSYLIDMGLKQHDEDLIGRGWKIVEKNQDRIYHLVMDMLSYSAERKPALQVANVNDVVRDVCELMEPHAAECQVELTCQLSDQVPESAIDPEGIHRAVLNIVTNAIEAVEGATGGRVTVETSYDLPSDELVVLVRDNGPGIPAAQQAMLFNIFESTKGSRGTGLGLAVSQKVIREHGGDIFVESREGEGATFRLVLARLDEAAARAYAP